MQTANILLAIGGDPNNLVPKYGVTPAEVAVLRVIHGEDAVTNVEVTDKTVNRTHRQEIGRLADIYGRWEDNQRVSPAVNRLFPGAAARVFEKFDELELPDELYAPKTRKTGRDPLDHDGDGRKGGSLTDEARAEKGLDGMTVNELRAYADKEGIDLTGVTLKADILEAIKLHEANKGGDDGEDDEVGEMPEEGNAPNAMFE